MKRLCLAVAFAAGLSAPSAVWAEGTGYVFGAAGISSLRDLDANAATFGASIETERAPSLIVGLGRQFGSVLRGELELSHTSHDVDAVSGAQGSGGVDGLVLGGNLVADLQVPSMPLTPYVGLGTGIIRLSIDSIAPVGGSTLDDDATVPFIQGIAGASYDINERISLFGDLRYRASQSFDMTTRSGAAVSPSYSDTRLLVGVRWRFAAPPPPPPQTPPAVAAPAAAAQPAPAPKPRAEAPPPKSAPAPREEIDRADIPREYLIFFDWDRADITSEANEILRAAAANANELQSVRITATGHADRSGPDDYNVDLSRRRAFAARDVLVRQGVPLAEIEIIARGESQPLVPTPDGVREPRNRRVQIILD